MLFRWQFHIHSWKSQSVWKSEVSPEDKDTTSFYTQSEFDRRGPVIWVGIARSGLDQAADGRIFTAHRQRIHFYSRWTNDVALADTK